MIGVQSYLQAKQQEDVHNAMQQRVAQQQAAGQYQAALRQAYVVKPDTGEVDVAATRKNLGALDPRLAMQFDKEQQMQQANMVNLSRKNEVAQSLIAERRSKILGAAKENALKHYFGTLQKTQDPAKAQQAAMQFYDAQIGDAQKNMQLPTGFKPAAFNVESALGSLNEDGSAPALMNDEGQSVNAAGEPQQQDGMMPVATKAPAPAMPSFPPSVGKGGVDWGEAYQMARLYKINPATALMIINPRTGQPMPNEPLIAQKERMAKAGKTDVNVTAAGGDVVMPGVAARNELDKDIEYANKLGLPVSDEQKARLTEFSRFRQDAYDNMNRYIKEITGAAMSETEANRLRKAMPDPENDSPAAFKAKIDHSMEILQAAGERYQKLRTEGLSVKQSQFEVKKDLLNGLAPLQTQVNQPKPMSPKAPMPQAPGQPKATKRYNPVSGKFEVIQ